MSIIYNGHCNSALFCTHEAQFLKQFESFNTCSILTLSEFRQNVGMEYFTWHSMEYNTGTSILQNRRKN